MKIGTVIKALRRERGWTQVELAGKLGISQKVLATYETSVHKPSIDRVVLIAKILKVSSDELLGIKKSNIKITSKGMHKNNRSAQIQSLFDKLPANDQRSILKMVKSLAANQK